MHDVHRTANLLGATALAVSDLMLADVRAATHVSVSGAAALVVLAHAPDLGVTELGRRVGLSQPAAARMVDSLVAAGLARRGQAQGRSVAVSLTRAGKRAVKQVLAARAEGLAGLVTGLEGTDRRVLTDLLERLLAQFYAEVRNADLLCRLCDRAACTDSAVCPVGQAERDAGV